MDVAARTEELALRVAEDNRVELVHVEYLSKGSPPILRLYIDREGGVRVEDCERVSRHLSVLLEVEDLIDAKYVLEVSSPGIERPLFKPADYVKFNGKKIRLKSLEKIEERQNFVGVIEDTDDGTLTLNCDGRRYRIPFEKVKKANLVHKF